MSTFAAIFVWTKTEKSTNIIVRLVLQWCKLHAACSDLNWFMNKQMLAYLTCFIHIARTPCAFAIEYEPCELVETTRRL